MHDRIMAYRDLPEIRRAIRYLLNNHAKNTKTLASLKRAKSRFKGSKIFASNFSTRVTVNQQQREEQERLEKEAEQEAKHSETLDSQTAKMLSDLAHNLDKIRKEKDSARNIKHLLETYFDVNQNNIANRMLKLANQLVTDTENLFYENADELNELTNKVVPQSFKSFVSSVVTKLTNKINTSYAAIGLEKFPKPNYIFQALIAPYNHLTSFIMVAYIEFKNVNINGVNQDFYITITHIKPYGVGGWTKESRIEVATKYWARTLTSYQTPSWLANNFVGVEINRANIEETVNKLYMMIQAENIVHTASPSASPLTLKDIENALPEELKDRIIVSRAKDSEIGSVATKGMIRLQVKPSSKDIEDQDYYAEVKKLLPDIKNLLIRKIFDKQHHTKTKPLIQIYKANNSKGETIYGYKITFAASDDISKGMDLPAETLLKVSKLLNIKDENVRIDIMNTLKQRIGLIQEADRRSMKDFIEEKLKYLHARDPSTTNKNTKEVDETPLKEDIEDTPVEVEEDAPTQKKPAKKKSIKVKDVVEKSKQRRSLSLDDDDVVDENSSGKDSDEKVNVVEKSKQRRRLSLDDDDVVDDASGNDSDEKVKEKPKKTKLVIKQKFNSKPTSGKSNNTNKEKEKPSSGRKRINIRD
jgi:hypothetical protein